MQIFSRVKFVGVNRLFVLVYSNQDAGSKDLKLIDIIYKNA